MEGARLLDDAKAEIEQEKKAAIADIRKQVATLSVEIAEKVLKETRRRWISSTVCWMMLHLINKLSCLWI